MPALLLMLLVAGASSFRDIAISINESIVDLRHGPHLLDVAVLSGTHARIPLTSARQTVVYQSGAGLFIDCEPWASQFEGGTVQWYKQVVLYDDEGAPDTGK